MGFGKAYIDTVDVVPKPAPKNDRIWSFSDRKLMGGSKWLFFDQYECQDAASQSAEWSRGAISFRDPLTVERAILNRNVLGAQSSQMLKGTSSGPNGHAGPGISKSENQLKDWTIGDFVFGFQTVLKPDGDVTGVEMGEVVEEGTSHMSDEDLKAMAVYLLSFVKGEVK